MKKNAIVTLIIIIVLIGGVRVVLPKKWSESVIYIGQYFSRIGAGLEVIKSRITNVSFINHSSNNYVLHEEINNLSLKSNDRDLLEKENQELKSLLGRNQGRNLILATVLSKPTITPFDTFTIDIGSNLGVQNGDTILAGSSTAIGYVSETYKEFSKVTAFSSPNIKHSVYVGETNIQAEAIGQGNGNYKIILPEGSDVKVGDNVIVPNIVPTIFGIVEKIVPNDQPSFVNILFKAPVDLNDLYYVYVAK